MPKPNKFNDGSYAGEIRTFGGETPPDGWFECDGRPLENKKYPKLYAAIGDAWGSPKILQFNLPDLRGTFIRGWNHGRADNGADPDVSGRLVPAGAPAGSSDHVGTWQKDDFAVHDHTTTLTGRWGDKSKGDIGWGADDAPNKTVPITTSTKGGNETRPKNAYVMFCIRHD